ncbi:MAG: DUF2959 family protein [Balneolaceae bacterium]
MKSFKSSRSPFVICITIIGLIFIGFYGCQTSNVDRAERTTTSMQTLNEDLNTMIDHIDQVEASLNNLTNPQQENIRQVYEEYSSRVEEMESHGERLITHADEMNEQGDEYFSEWEQQDGSYTNPQIQRLSQERRRELRSTYSEIIEANNEVRQDLRRYISDTEEIQDFLSHDLSTRGIESISSLIPEVIDDGEQLKASINRVQYSIDVALSEMERPGSGQEQE